MSQISFADAEQAGKRKKTRREVFLGEMELVVPWKALLKVIEPHYPVAGRGRRPYPLQAMLRVHLMQNWFALSDPAMEEALYEIASLRTFAGLGLEAIPDETTILNFRHLLEASDLAEDIFKQVNAHLAKKGLLLKRGSIVDATIIAAPSSTKNSTGERDPEMHQTKKGNQWHFGMKAHIGVDADSGLVHTVTTTAANEADVEQLNGRCAQGEMLEDRVLHADETPVAMLEPGNGKTHRAYLWSYCTTSYSALRAVVFDFADSRGGAACSRLPRAAGRAWLARHAGVRRLQWLQGVLRARRHRGGLLGAREA